MKVWINRLAPTSNTVLSATCPRTNDRRTRAPGASDEAPSRIASRMSVRLPSRAGVSPNTTPVITDRPTAAQSTRPSTPTSHIAVSGRRLRSA